MKKQFTILLKWGAVLGVALSCIQLARKFSDTFDFYAFGPIIDMLNALLFVGVLYMGIKEIKNEIYDQVISFSKAFLQGLVIVFFAFFIVFIYLNLHYGLFFKDQMQVVNEMNYERFYNQLEKDSIKTYELDSVLTQHKQIVVNQQEKVVIDAQLDSINSQNLKLRVDTILDFYNHFMKNQPITSENFQLGKFDQYAKSTMMDILVKFIAKYPKTDTSLTFLSTVVINGSEEFKNVSVLDKRFTSEKSKIPLHKNSFSASLYFSITVILFGILFNIFVSMYLYKRKPKQTQTQTNA